MAAPLLIVIGGPTASGKTPVATELAKKLNTEIISADSRQLYSEMNTGTAKPSKEELESVPHHFISSHSIEEDYSAGQYEQDALQLLDKIFPKTDKAILAGGSGLYIDAVLKGIDPIPGVPREVMQELEGDLKRKGLSALRAELEESDPAYFEQADTENPRRVLRALGVIRTTGKPFSNFQKGTPAPRPFQAVKFCLHLERKKLYGRINARVDQMIEQGLVEEARELWPQRHLKPLQTVGYQELFAYFDGNCSLEDAIGKIKQHTRNYAKRQLTWFKRDADWKWIEMESHAKAIKTILEAIRAAS